MSSSTRDRKDLKMPEDRFDIRDLCLIARLVRLREKLFDRNSKTPQE